MSLETQTVNPTETATVTPVNDQQENSPETTTESSNESTQSQETTQESTSTVTTAPINADLYDERGVPWKNVAMEQRRKYEESQQNLPKLVAEEIAKSTQQQKPKYTVAELEKFAQENPEYKPWAEQEKMNLLKSELERTVQSQIEATTQKQRDEAIRAQVFNRVISQFPDIAVRDQAGNFLGWNNTNPMTHAVGKYMSDPRIANDPHGLEIASKLAYADTMMAKTPQTQKQIASLKSQVKKVQAQTFVEGGGRKVGETVSETKKHLERVAQTGRSEDAAGVFRSIHRQMGLTKE